MDRETIMIDGVRYYLSNEIICPLLLLRTFRFVLIHRSTDRTGQSGHVNMKKAHPHCYLLNELLSSL